MNFRRYNVGLSRDPQPDLYQTRCELAYNEASDMPFEAMLNSLDLKRLAKQGVRDTHTECVKTGLFHSLGQTRLTLTRRLCQPIHRLAIAFALGQISLP